ncbi:MAG TPA: dinitrogenase iron-molybdenum cofactor biosynthesis protein [Methanomicrobia archaeon]|nr:dinitrogenase iron-molybdenum cofactor biosynthesis protein [Methanomicrobia archaeon]
MKICVTAVADRLDAQVDPRFGRSQYFVIVDPATMDFESRPNPALNAPGGAGIQAAQAMVNEGVDVVISGNMGPNAFQVLSAAGVKIATGAYGTVKDAIELYQAGKLAEAGTATVVAHAGMAAVGGAGVGTGLGGGRGGGGRGMGRGMGLGMQQPAPQQPQQTPAVPTKAKDEDIEQLSTIVESLEKNLEEVKKRIAELKKK